MIEPRSARPGPDAEPLIELRGLTKSYEEAGREHLVLDGVDLAIARGEIVVLLGRSGSGKSTLLNLLAGIDRPSRGTIQVDGRELGGLDERDAALLRRRLVGFIFQFFNLVPTLTVLENLLLPLELADRLDDAGRRRAAALLERVGLDGRGDSFPDVLSGGEQQRVAIARALVHEPALVLADEPTGNLDEETAEAVLALLESAVRDAGATLVMATHSRDVARRADRVLRVRDGGIHPESLPGERDPA